VEQPFVRYDSMAVAATVLLCWLHSRHALQFMHKWTYTEGVDDQGLMTVLQLHHGPKQLAACSTEC
jgi:hypothetical protein